MACEKKPTAQWTVAEVYEGPSDTLIRIVTSGNYGATPHTPPVGASLILKPDEEQD